MWKITKLFKKILVIPSTILTTFMLWMCIATHTHTQIFFFCTNDNECHYYFTFWKESALGGEQQKKTTWKTDATRVKPCQYKILHCSCLKDSIWNMELNKARTHTHKRRRRTEKKQDWAQSDEGANKVMIAKMILWRATYTILLSTGTWNSRTTISMARSALTQTTQH